MNIELGKYYRTRGGQIAGPIVEGVDGWPFGCRNIARTLFPNGGVAMLTWQQNGIYLENGEHEYDLVEEVNMKTTASTADVTTGQIYLLRFLDSCAKTSSINTPESKCSAASRINAYNIQLLHGAIGIATEAGELLDAIKKFVFYGEALDRTNILEELGDLLWYVSEALTCLKSTYPEIMEAVIKKLEKRYGETFTQKAALERNIEEERSVLEECLESDSEHRLRESLQDKLELIRKQKEQDAEQLQEHQTISGKEDTAEFIKNSQRSKPYGTASITQTDASPALPKQPETKDCNTCMSGTEPEKWPLPALEGPENKYQRLIRKRSNPIPLLPEEEEFIFWYEGEYMPRRTELSKARLQETKGRIAKAIAERRGSTETESNDS